MAPRRAEEIPVKRVAALGCRLPSHLPAGEILTDITQQRWRLGQSIGSGGFGDVYLASNNVDKPVGEDAKFVIKIEPHNNGPLFVEMNFYIRVARKYMIESWSKSQRLRRIPVPTYEGSGSHIYQGERYRFLVIPRYGVDVGKLFLAYSRKLPMKLIYTLAIQMLDALEYIHSRGYVHADVKGSNILMELNDRGREVQKPQAYLVDYGLACRFRTRAGVHKPFAHDERRAHEGTLEFTSRDAHHGTHSRRGDLESLGYNLLQWLCGRLPWEKADGGLSPTVNPEDIHAQKEILLSNIPLLMRECFPDKKHPGTIKEYMEYVAGLEFEARPDYSYLRGLFSRGIKRESSSPVSPFSKAKRHCNENISGFKSIEKNAKSYLRNATRNPCKPVNCQIRKTRNTHTTSPKNEFSWEAVLARHPDKFAKDHIQVPPSSLTPPTPPPSPPPPALPTYAMLQVLQKMKEKQAGVARCRSTSKSFDNDLVAKWMTPVMEKVAQLKKKTTVPIQTSNPTSNQQFSPRLTRSRAAHLKRLADKTDRQQTKDCYSLPTISTKKRDKRGRTKYS